MRLNYREEMETDKDMSILWGDFKAFQRQLVDLNADGQDDEAPIGAE